jgi:hypothetical protein
MSGLLRQKLFEPASGSWKGEGSMTTLNLPEAKRAWLIAQMIEELNELLWRRYEDEFITYLMEEDNPYYQSILSDLK